MLTCIYHKCDTLRLVPYSVDYCCMSMTTSSNIFTDQLRILPAHNPCLPYLNPLPSHIPLSAIQNTANYEHSTHFSSCCSPPPTNPFISDLPAPLFGLLVSFYYHLLSHPPLLVVALVVLLLFFFPPSLSLSPLHIHLDSRLLFDSDDGPPIQSCRILSRCQSYIVHFSVNGKDEKERSNIRSDTNWLFLYLYDIVASTKQLRPSSLIFFQVARSRRGISIACAGFAGRSSRSHEYLSLPVRSYPSNHHQQPKTT